MTGGLLLQWMLGYNFSVAVWVGYIALFGTAIQTGVVMVVYLEEAVVSLRENSAASSPAPNSSPRPRRGRSRERC